VNSYGIFDREWLKWIMIVCMICWWLIFTLVTYIGLRFVRHSPPRKPRMKNMDVSEEEAVEMKQFNIKTVKAQYVKRRHGSPVNDDNDNDNDNSSSPSTSSIKPPSNGNILV
jgi:hypothetical protein